MGGLQLGFDVLTAAAYKVLGLAGLPVLSMLLHAAIAVALLFLVRLGQVKCWAAVLLVGLAQYCIGARDLQTSLVSIVLFTVVLALLLRSRCIGRLRSLLLRP